MQSKVKPEVKKRLNRIAGQVAGLQKMVEEDRYCMDILTQIAAVRSALDAVGVALLTDHIEGCVVGHGTGSDHPSARQLTREELTEEVRKTLKRFL